MHNQEDIFPKSNTEKDSNQPIISAQNVSKWYGAFQALNNINMEVYKGEVIVIFGPSGSGKSTFIRCINRLEEHDEGKIIVGTVKEKANEILEALRTTREGKRAEIIGKATSDFSGVAAQTPIGGKRIVARPIGDPIPRIC